MNLFIENKNFCLIHISILKSLDGLKSICFIHSTIPLLFLWYTNFIEIENVCILLNSTFNTECCVFKGVLALLANFKIL